MTNIRGWDIQPSIVQRVLNETIATRNELVAWGRAYHSHLNSVATSAGTLSFPGLSGPAGQGGQGGQSSPVGSALAAFANATLRDVLFLTVRTDASVNGARAATNAYVRGDEEMMREAHSRALRTPRVVLPSEEGNPPGGGGRSRP